MKLKFFYRITSVMAFLLILCFMTSSLISEFLGDYIIIATVKKSIFYTLPLLIICMILTGISARKLALLYPNIPYNLLVIRRVKCIGLTGVVFLAPIATVLNYLAQNKNLGAMFYLLQSLEIVFGLINITFFIKIFRDEKKFKEN
ncbi:MULTISPECIES: hypothetical protein [unclassified Clostridium]|uniref:hypothetical protein n=1 Tax=unclassified Clostridium TaxID=2614128 RepID=UPI000297F1C1|nr:MULTISPECIES: hypothetical protein [unclassified Clostridium]EKQ58190.1 MAG: hypothetical protein A370_00045 [Clostridium sp. Maddingley MBC34-26]